MMIFMKLTAFILSFFVVLSVPGVTGTHDVKDPENCRLNFTVLSDVHMEGNNNTRLGMYTTILRDVKNSESKNDALFFLGDNTMNGQHIENMFFYGVLDRINPAERAFAVTGNHDTGNGSGQYDKLYKRSIDYFNAYFKEGVLSPYYLEIINGYYFIVLGAQEDSVNYSKISSEQLDWLDNALDLAQTAGVPAFVFNHHPSVQSDLNARFYNILTEHKDVFFFSGHTHTSKLTTRELDSDSHYFNLPRCTEHESSNEDANMLGSGVQVELYKGKVVVRERHYNISEWGREFEFTVGR